MAEQNLDPELIERVNRELATMGQLTSTTAQDLQNAQTGIKNFQQKVSAAGGAVGALSDAFVTYNKEVYKGSSANQAAAASMDKLADAARYAGAFLALIVPGGPLVKAFVGGLGLLAGKMAEAGKEIALQTDQVFKAYQDLAKAGAAGKGGMQDVFNGLQKVGLGTEKFATYLKLVSENSDTLVKFGGTMNRGRKMYEETMGSFTRQQRVEMEQMGLDREAQADATMLYIRQQRLLTMGTKAQMEVSSAAVMRYVKETDELTRITGANRAEQQKLVEKMMSEEIFAAYTDSLEAQGEAGKARAKAERNNAMILEKLLGPEFARGVRDGSAQFIGATEASKKAFMAAGGATAEYAAEMEAAGGDVDRSRAALDKLVAAVADNYKIIQRDLAQMGVSEGVFGKVSENRNAITVAQIGITESLVKAEKERLDQLANDPTKKMAEAENAVRETQLELQRILNSQMDMYIDATRLAAFANRELVFKTGKLASETVTELENAFTKLLKALEPLTTEIGKLMSAKVLPAFTRAMEDLADFISKITAAKTTEDRVRISGEMGVAETVGGVGGAYAGMKGGAALGAGFGAAFGGVGAAPGAIIGGGLGALGGYFGGRGLGRAADAAAQNKSFMDQLRAMFNMGVSAPPGGLGSEAAGAKAKGGPVAARTPYLVGEEGPELFVPSIAGDIVPTDKLKGTTGAVLQQSKIIENMVNSMVSDTALLMRTAGVDANRYQDHSRELKTQREKIELAIETIASTTIKYNNLTKSDMEMSNDYSKFYKLFLARKQALETKQLEKLASLINSTEPTEANSLYDLASMLTKFIGSAEKRPALDTKPLGRDGVDRVLQTLQQVSRSLLSIQKQAQEIQPATVDVDKLSVDISAALQQGQKSVDTMTAKILDITRQYADASIDQTSMIELINSVKNIPQTAELNTTELQSALEKMITKLPDSAEQTQNNIKSLQFLAKIAKEMPELQIDSKQLDVLISKFGQSTTELSKLNEKDRQGISALSSQMNNLIATMTLVGAETAGVADTGKAANTGRLKLPTRPGIPSMGGAQGMSSMTEADLKAMGLRIKQGDVQSENAGISPQLIELAKKIQSTIPEFRVFTGFNDRWHQEKASSSQHTKGLAVDFTLQKPPTPEAGRMITDWLRTQGASLAIDEYNNPTTMSTGGHIHAQIPAFEQGGTLGAGRIGIAGEGGKPELITGPADITPMNDLMRAFGNMTSLLEISVGKLDAIARATAATSDSSARMLNYAQN